MLSWIHSWSNRNRNEDFVMKSDNTYRNWKLELSSHNTAISRTPKGYQPTNNKDTFTLKAQKQETEIAMSTTNNTTTMKAMQVHDFVSDYTNLDKIMTMSNDIEIPKPKKDQILLKVLACSISPGDLIMVQGISGRHHDQIGCINIHEGWRFRTSSPH